jgi:hypothetical protein
MKTYNFKVVVEPDEDFDGNPAGWHAYCPFLEKRGASTWGTTQSEAVKNMVRNSASTSAIALPMISAVYHDLTGYRALESPRPAEVGPEDTT